MDTVLKVSGIHCNSCKSLIQMEIEDLNLTSKLKNIEVKENNIGEVKLTKVTEEEVKKITNSINKLGSYKVV